MRKLTAAGLLTALAAQPAAAEPRWNGAGWYQIEDLEIWGWIYSGPYWSEVDCKASLPATQYDDLGDYYVTYYCEYLDTRPSWDE
jgi:hypothetical protein